MCGIVGAIVFNDYQVTSDYLVKMRDTMIHRGPDGAGVWVHANGRVGLGHRRLSIIDLSSNAAQPMQSADKTLVLTFNGEIYNYADIKRELIELGYQQWRTDHSDTEVLLYAFKEWGIDCVHRLRGMFAFAIWDTDKEELWLVRDRIGIKPLYYSFHHQRLTFASEIKALLQDPEQQRVLNNHALYHYLSFLTTPAPDTLFDGIKKLPAGTWLKVNAKGDVQEKKYWDVWEHTQDLQHATEKEITGNVLALLTDAVESRKISDVPIGVFLSGGVDSSTNAALFAKDLHMPINTFSIGYQGEYQSYQNELTYAKEMAEFVGANYHEKLLTQDDLINFVPKMVYLQDEPIADPVCVPVYYVSQLAKQNGVTVCQVGEGADELFWGYTSWKVKHKLQRFGNVPLTRPFKQLLAYGLQSFGKTNSPQYELLRRNIAGLPIFWGGAEAFTEQQKRALLHPKFLAELGDISSWDAIKPIWQRYQANAKEKSILNWMSYLDLNFRLPELLLMRVDKMSMGVSLEARVPFLDHQFVEYAMSIPSKLKTTNGISKYILKQAVRGVIPDQIIDRKKQGFGVPVYEWCFDKLGNTIRNDIRNFCLSTTIFDPKIIEGYLNNPQGHLLWYLYNLISWVKAYDVKGC